MFREIVSAGAGGIILLLPEGYKHMSQEKRMVRSDSSHSDTLKMLAVELYFKMFLGHVQVIRSFSCIVVVKGFI